MAGGTYTITITDANGCTAIDDDTVIEPTVLLASITVDNNVSCNGSSDGSLTASSSGGTMPYTYLWSNGATTASNTGLAAGTYTVTITDANGCTATDDDMVTEPVALSASVTVDNNVSCNGLSDGALTASGSGGTMPYTYLWSTGATTASITSISGGTYTVTITDANGCVATDDDTVMEPAFLFANVVVDTNVSCNGFSDGGLTASAIGGTMPYTYVWSTGATTAGITGLIAGTYTATITDANGCTDVDVGTITEPVVLAASVAVDNNVSCNGLNDGSLTASATGGTMTYTYAWSNGSTTATNAG